MVLFSSSVAVSLLSSCALALHARSHSYGKLYAPEVRDLSVTCTTAGVSKLATPAPASQYGPGFSVVEPPPSGASYPAGKPSEYPTIEPSGYPTVKPPSPTYGSGNGTYEPKPTDSSCASFWLENIKHQGVASFNRNSSSSYKVFRNVKDYGAVGDGKTDDTAAIQRAMNDGNRCAPGVCESSTTTPATVYFPHGTYLISSSIIDYYYTMIIGNPNCLPTIVAASNFSMTAGLGIIDGSPYQGSGPRVGKTGFGPTNTFFRQISNLVLDTTKVGANETMRGIHWPTAQTTSIQNVVFKMNAANGTLHEGLFIEEGSGGFMTDLVFEGGNYGFNVGNQQFTTRNLTFNNCNTAINQLWDWGWTYKSVSINNCRVGLNVSAGGPAAVNVGSITFFDSSIKNTPIGIASGRTDDSQPEAGGALYLENVKIENVRSVVTNPDGTVLEGTTGASVIAGWADGHQYLPNGPQVNRGPIEPTKRPGTLIDAQGKYLEISKPKYEAVPVTGFISARDQGTKGDGKTDDTEALNAAILKAQKEGKILFVDAGFYKVTGTIYIPPGSKIIGEALASVILSSGAFFNDMENPQPVVQVAKPGEQGTIEWSDMFISTQGQQKGAILIQYNLASVTGTPAGMWDVHTRIGGFAGSNLQTEQCEKTPDVTITPENLVEECIAAYMSMHITKFGTGLYMENNWLWTADHDLDDARNNNTQITIYAGRGLLVESQRGIFWLYGTAVEHHVKYEYQFVDTRDVFMGQIQTETAYYQPNPEAVIPFPPNPALSDPVFTPSPPTSNNTNSSSNNADGWGLRIVRSSNIHGYGVGLYSFFDNYNTSCSDISSGAICQTRIFSLEGQEHVHDINIYNLNTVGTTNMITRDGVDLANQVDNNSTYVDTINVFRIGSFGQ